MVVETGAGEGAEQDIRFDAVRATPSVEPRGLMTRALTLLFAVAGGVAVGNLYLAQPLLDLIARDLGASTASAGWLDYCDSARLCGRNPADCPAG